MKMDSEDQIQPSSHNWTKVFLHWLLLLILIAILGTGALFVKKVYSQDSNVSVNVNKASEIKKGDEMVIHFSSPMLQESVDSGIKIDPQIAVSKRWRSETDLVIKPLEVLRPESVYSVRISGAKSKWMIPQREFSFQFNSPKSPSLLDVYPQNNQDRSRPL